MSQNKKIDSLLILLKTDRVDTSLVNTMYQLSREFRLVNGFDTAMNYADKALELARKLNFEKGVANSLHVIGAIAYDQNNYTEALKNYNASLLIREELDDKIGRYESYKAIGLIYKSQGDYAIAFDYCFKAFKIADGLGDKKRISTILGNMGNVYKGQSNFPKALDCYFKALKIDEELKYKIGITIHLGNIGIVYRLQGNSSKALEYYFKALKLSEEIGDKEGIARHLGNIGNVYVDQNTNTKALEFYLKALKMAEELKKKGLQANSLANIGNIYYETKDYSQALNYLYKALEMEEELGNKTAIALNLGNIGGVFFKTGEFKESEQYLNKSITIFERIGTLDYLPIFEKMLSELYDTTAQIAIHNGQWMKAALNYEKSIFHLKRTMELKDTLFSQENKKQLVQKELNYEFNKKEAATKAEQDKKDALVLDEQKRQRFVLILVTSFSVLVFLLAGLIFRSLRVTRKQKRIIEIKNTQTELQKKVIEGKNKDITDSIYYAKRIQDALLQGEERVTLNLPEHFVLFIPKDIVSGDFYWATEKNEFCYFVVGDCTGHGVPGAVMSMLGISFLNDIVNSESLLSPAEILNRLRNKVIKELKQTGEDGGSKDGMDISMVRLNLKTLEMQWAGANNPLNLIRNGELEKIKADKQPIGYHPESHPFTNHEIQLKKEDSIYIFSDGYADQFGGPNGKKFTYKKTENLLRIYNHKPMKDQKGLLKKRFIEWKGALEQVDDVCVIGVRL